MSTVGDVGYVDEDGYLYLTDRATFMIICGGVNIYPQECENLLITHPKIADAAVFGVPNADLGEEVKAVVQLMPGVAPGADAGGGADRLLRPAPCAPKCPRSVDFEPELPRLPTGKLYKRRLRDRYWGRKPRGSSDAAGSKSKSATDCRWRQRILPNSRRRPLPRSGANSSRHRVVYGGSVWACRNSRRPECCCTAISPNCQFPKSRSRVARTLRHDIVRRNRPVETE